MDLLKSKLLVDAQNLINPNSIFSFQDIKIINQNIQFLGWDQTEKENLQKTLKEIKKYTKGKSEILEEYLLNNSKIAIALIEVRNECIFQGFALKLTEFFDASSEYIKTFYREFDHIASDAFMEIEGALFQLEYIKHFKMKELFSSHNIYDFDFHKNYKEVIYIYSCFDKIATLFRMFHQKSDAKEIKKLLFSQHMIKEYVNDYNHKKIIEKTDAFINSKLFQDFKKIRNSITHNYTMPMDEYYTNIYSFVGLFLLLYYVNEILIKELSANKTRN